jgi:leucyl aminopeptidase (aminopeptidase T)
VNHSKPEAGALRLLTDCGSATKSDRILIVYDATTKDTAEIVDRVARQLGFQATLAESPTRRMHGEEPAEAVAQRMAECDLILGLTSKSMAHTRARANAGKHGARYLSLPDYSVDLLADASLTADFKTTAPKVRRVADCLSKGKLATITTESGTNIKIRIDGRTGNYCPGFVAVAGELGSPPDIEANVSPLEDGSDGVVVVDGSIPYPGLGLLTTPVRLEVRKGLIVKMESSDRGMLAKLEELFAMQDQKKTRVLAELGIGLNEKARLTGSMLTDEGAAGTAHFGFGSNSTVGGKNEVSFHLDFVFRQPTLYIDDQLVLSAGKLVLE